MSDPLEPIAQRVAVTFGLETRLALAITREVVDALSDSVDGYIVRRHEELKREGLANEAIFEAIRLELPKLRFSASEMSARQIRRRIYG